MSLIKGNKIRIYKEAEKIFPEVFELNRWLYENPELPRNEYRAVEKTTDYLKQNGFEIQYKTAGLDTAFTAKYVVGEGGPKIGFLAEYDALPEVGHGCGHNIIASSCVGAAVALSRSIKTPVELIVYGTPDEEYDGGKIIMAEAGVFSDLDAAMQIHVSTDRNEVGVSSTPHQTMVVSFHGKPAHTAANPTEGVNALNAVILTFVALNAILQYLKPGTRIPATITHGGGAPNAVPQFAQMRIHVTTLEPDYLLEVVEKIENCARAGGLATGAKVDIWKGPIYKKLYPNKILTEILEENMRALGRKLQDPPPATAATDVGNVSRECPTIMAHISLDLPGAALHTKEVAAATVGEKGEKALTDSIKAMAGTAVDIITNPKLLAEMKNEFENK